MALRGRPGSDQGSQSRVSIDRQVRDEIEAHFEMLVRDAMGRGMSDEQAERDARRRFGDVRRYAREGRAIRLRHLRAARRTERWAGLLHDLRGATRALRSSPGFVAGTVLMLGVGIGVATALFSITSAVLLRPLPFERPEELFVLRGAPITVSPGLRAPEDLLDWHPHVARSFAALAAYQPFGQSVNLTGIGEPRHAIATEVSPGFFSLLGTRMVAGRAFSAEEATANRQVAVIGERFWRRQWAADPEVIGRIIQINGRPYRVLGIVPSRAQLPAEAELWVPIGYAFEDMVGRGARFFSVLGRTRPGVSREAMERDLATFRSWLDENVVWTMQASGDQELEAVSLLDSLVGSVRRPLWLPLAATVLVLVVTNANVANFMASRSRWRRREYAVRAALGAGTRRLMQQAIAESLLLAAGGGLVGAMVAAWSLGAVRALEHISLPRAESFAAGLEALRLRAAVGCVERPGDRSPAGSHRGAVELGRRAARRRVWRPGGGGS